MLYNFDPKWLTELGHDIAELERASLDKMTPDEFDPADVFDEHDRTFFSIEGLANFWSTEPGIDFVQHITDLIVGAHNQRQAALTFVLEGTPQKLQAYISLGTVHTTRTLLEGILPGIQLKPLALTNLAQHLRTHLQTRGMITGIPSRKPSTNSTSTPMSEANETSQSSRMSSTNSPDGQGLSQLERVIRGMQGATWVYIVRAHPRPRNKVVEDRMAKVDLLAHVASGSRIQLQATTQETYQKTEIISGATTEPYSGEKVNYRAQYLTRLLERELERLDQAAAAGQWTVSTYFGASNPDDSRRLASLLVGTLAGKDSRPDPIRAYMCRRGGDYLTYFSTFLSSDEVAALIQLPREEVPGYAIHDFVRFDVDFRLSSPAATVALGKIQQNDKDTESYRIALNDLTKHGVVVGVTGSGKTTTVMNLLDSVVEAGKPFLVIEPAKTEYRALRNALAGRTDLHIYTLGSETLAPFRLNPFEFETDDDPENVSILNHIDFLKAVFNAAFILYAPMPYVLEMALHEIYEDKGWDLASGENIRLPDWTKRDRYPIFPTLTDLYRKVEVVTDRLGYEARIEQDVKAGLKARIGSMRIGAKGWMLDTARGIPMKKLLSSSIILEMENIGSDDEKTFLMGLLLAKLYEYRRLQAASATLSGELQHLIVFEEAHRLLKNTSTQVDTESSNMRAQAIETFTNMLSEVRAYGQGVLVAEQIPSKLAPDVLKNTNLKIAHRLIAQDDRESVGRTMNLNADQITHLGVLSPGMAAVYAEGADHAYLVQLDNYKRKLTAVSNSELKKVSPTYISVEPCLAIPGMFDYRITRSQFGGPEDAKAYEDAGKLLETEQSRWLWASILIRTLFSPSKLLAMLDKLLEQITAELPHIQMQSSETLLRMVIVRGCAETLQERGATFGWTYPMVEEMRVSLTQGLITLRQTRDLSYASGDLDRFAREYEKRLKRKQGPFAGCVHCSAKCTYRPDVRNLLSRSDRMWVDGDLKEPSYKSHTERYTAISKKVKAIAERWLGGSSIVVPDIGFCGALHAVARSGYTEYEQYLFGERLAKELLGVT